MTYKIDGRPVGEWTFAELAARKYVYVRSPHMAECLPCAVLVEETSDGFVCRQKSLRGVLQFVRKDDPHLQPHIKRCPKCYTPVDEAISRPAT
jgi:hypothetical protein